MKRITIAIIFVSISMVACVPMNPNVAPNVQNAQPNPYLNMFQQPTVTPAKPAITYPNTPSQVIQPTAPVQTPVFTPFTRVPVSTTNSTQVTK
jgi:hypothetical protein